jgi:hypothetical protein
MVHLGSELGVILNDRELREAALRDVRRPRRRGPSFHLRARLASALVALAVRIEPFGQSDGQQSLSESLPLLDRGVRFGGTL